MNTAVKGNKTVIKKGNGGKRKYYAELYGLMALPLLAILIFSYVPMFGIIIAFKDYRFNKGILGSEWIGLKNFDFFLKSNDNPLRRPLSHLPRSGR